MLSQIGCISLPAEVLQKVISNQKLSEEEKAMYERCPEEGALMIGEIPKLEGVAEIVRLQSKGYAEIKDLDLDYEIKIAANALRLICDFDVAMESETSTAKAIHKVRQNPDAYHPKLYELIGG